MSVFFFHRAVDVLSLYTMQRDVSHGLPGFLEGFIFPVPFRHLYEVWVVGVLVGVSCSVLEVMGLIDLPLIGSFVIGV